MKPLPLLLALALLLAGCASEDDSADEPPATDDESGQATNGPDADAPAETGGGADDGADTTDDGADDGMTTDDPPAPNTPPTADLLADKKGGEAPVDINFTLEGSDADGDEVSWTFDADGDGVADSEGTNLPFNFTFSFTEVGNYTAVLEVTDGETIVNDTIPLQILEAVEEATEEAEEAADPCTQPDPHATEMVPGTVYETATASDGFTYIYGESNGIPGLQRTTAAAPAFGWNDPDGTCDDGDTIIY